MNARRRPLLPVYKEQNGRRGGSRTHYPLLIRQVPQPFGLPAVLADGVEPPRPFGDGFTARGARQCPEPAWSQTRESNPAHPCTRRAQHPGRPADAEGGGFEPPRSLNDPYSISSRVPSATRPTLQSQGGRIRTCDLRLPKPPWYQAPLRLEERRKSKSRCQGSNLGQRLPKPPCYRYTTP